MPIGPMILVLRTGRHDWTFLLRAKLGDCPVKHVYLRVREKARYQMKKKNKYKEKRKTTTTTTITGSQQPFTDLIEKVD